MVGDCSATAARVGCAIDCGSGATKMLVVALPGMQVLHEHEDEVMVKADITVNAGAISSPMEARLLRCLLDQVALASSLGATRTAVCFTAAFREATNGAAVVERFRAALPGAELRIVSQEEEGRLGFDTAATLSGVPRSRLIAWDSGGASFQLSSQCACFEGPWGSVSCATALMLRVQHVRAIQADSSPNPVTWDQCAELERLVRQSLARHGREPLARTEQRCVVAVGGPTSVFNMLVIGGIDPVCMRASDVRALLGRLVGRTDAELAALGYPQPAVLLPKLVLFLAVCEELDLEPVRFCASMGSCMGIAGRWLL